MRRTCPQEGIMNRATVPFQEADPIAHAAAEWLIELQSDEVSLERISAWQRWLAANDSHRLMFEQIESAWAALDGARDRKLPWPAETEVENDRYDGALPVSGWL